MCRELRAKDLERMKGMWEDARAREKRKATKEVKEELETLGKIQDWLESGNDVRCGLLMSGRACHWLLKRLSGTRISGEAGDAGQD